MPRHQPIPEEKKRAMIAQYSEGIETPIIAARYGVRPAYVRKISSVARVKKGGCLHRPKPKPEPQPVLREFGTHLRDYKAVRRGYDIPEGKEPDYIKALMTGMSCAKAARSVGAV